MSFSYKKLQEVSDEQLIEMHDNCATTTEVGVSYYLDELARRDTQRVNQSMLNCTKWITAMTAVILLATIANVVFAVID